MNRNTRLAVICAVVAVAMVGAAFAAVPLYRLFCAVTGFDGTTMRADTAPDQVLDRVVSVRFDTNVRGLEWDFRPVQLQQDVHVGATGIAFFRVTNTTDRPLSGTAAYNVVPESAGPYFQKLQCFCFEDQVVQPGETIEFPVQYFLAPEIETDREGRGIQEITLSYTFYPTAGFQARQVAELAAPVSHAQPLGGAG